MDDLDEFQVHTQFMELLKQNLSSRTISRIAEFAFQYRKYHDPLFEDILTTLKECSPTKRLNLFYLIDSLFKISQRYNYEGYTLQILSRLEQTIDLVLDIQRTNGKISKKPDKYGLSFITAIKKVLTVWKEKKFIQEDVLEYYISMLDKLQKLNPQPLSKEAIFRRMEEDRDRQKRQREESWARKDDEFLEAWSKCQVLSADDIYLFDVMKKRFLSRKVT